jgi:hypothetical protein
MNPVYAFALTVFDTPWTRAILAMIGANILLGLATALFSKQYHFYLATTGDFLLNRVVPYILGWAAVKIVAITALAGYQSASSAVEIACSAFVVAALLGKIADQMRALGMPLPTWAGDAPKPEATAKP